ncbi:hypothetical protein BTO04_05695 [Polaribacter sp. SA4-10]|uniref:hypothetical protein n=1 Tax=Polaribacter sp. SA4-10 TaxID=754397 RepID=UPI000B552611|nr:hypothetical protein [Polaribacter sp. SA4-10]ARV07998.1 hypothetical protein BTO04_05695 [Polaribacter sp. SA4-10]
MNTEVLNSKAAMLLEVGLNILHLESKEWLETIAFWKDEIQLLDNLLKVKKSQDDHKQDFIKILDYLDDLHANLFKYIENDIVAHEKLLYRLQQNEKGLFDAIYRVMHRQLKDRMDSFKSDFLNFKKIVFKYVKEV